MREIGSGIDQGSEEFQLATKAAFRARTCSEVPQRPIQWLEGMLLAVGRTILVND
jgi:hypothetical protein